MNRLNPCVHYLWNRQSSLSLLDTNINLGQRRYQYIFSSNLRPVLDISTFVEMYFREQIYVWSAIYVGLLDLLFQITLLQPEISDGLSLSVITESYLQKKYIKIYFLASVRDALVENCVIRLFQVRLLLSSVHTDQFEVTFKFIFYKPCKQVIHFGIFSSLDQFF